MHVELCNCADVESICRVVALYRPDTLFHAAAYKHVPMLEANALSAARNNILGTLATSLAARACSVERFVPVSTDKAVRPANLMVTTKRISELIIQPIVAESRDNSFTMITFTRNTGQ